MTGIKDRPKILVVGSFVKDLTVSTSRFPKVGETVLGCGFQTASGGKGANQAIQAARLGAHVTMVGKVGDDISSVAFWYQTIPAATFPPIGDKDYLEII